MKKSLIAVVAVVATLMAGAVTSLAASGTEWMGSNNNLKFSWHTGWNVQGDYTYAELVGYGNEKQVYARSGDSGEYSDWVSATTQKVSAKNFGPYKTKKYEAHGYWR